MSEQRIKELMSELVAELEATGSVEENTREIARKLESDIDDLVNPEIDTSENTIMEDVIALESIFASSHPVAEKIMREVINTLSRIGI